MNESPLSAPAPLDVRDFGRMLLRRKWLLLAPWVLATLGGVAAAFLLKPIYFSSTMLMLERPQQLQGALGGMVSGPSADQQADVMREQVQSSLFLRSVINASGVKSDPETRAWALKGGQRYPGLTPEDAVDAFLVNTLREAIAIKRSKGNVFQVIVEDYRSDRAQTFCKAVADQFIATSRASQLEATRATQEFSIEQQQIYKRRLEEAEGRLEAARRSAISTSITGSLVNERNYSLAQSLADQANIEVDEQRQHVGDLRAQFQGKLRENDPQLLSTPTTGSLVGQIASLERQLGVAMLTEGSSSGGSGVRVSLAKKSADLEAELSSVASRALPSLTQEGRDLAVRYRMSQADLASKETWRSYIASQVSAYQRQMVGTPDRELDITRITSEVEQARALYNSFLQQSAITQITEAFQNAKVSGHFVVLEPATRPISPSKPNRPLLLMLAFVVGAIVGVGGVLVVEHHDQSVKNAEEVESLLGLPVLGAVPRVEELQRVSRRSRSAQVVGGAGAPATGLPASRDAGLIHRLKVESPLGLEFRRIYLNLARHSGRTLPRSLLVTSSTRGEGKTTTTACLGITLAREHRQKLLLVDFDLRSPTLHRALGIPGSSWGLTQMLQNRSFDERFVRQTALANLDFLPAGKSERPAAELVDGESVEWFLREAMQRYELVVIDCAPNLAVPDPLIIGRAVEGVLYVVKAGTTVRKAAEYGVKVQREARDNLVGVLMNDVGEYLPQYYGYRNNAYGYNPEEVAGG